MTAPGHESLLISLLAACTACVGYAAGRLHQWYRMGLDRDEAYRDGYETATRSVFSTAARLIGPRRAARGTAAVRSAASASAREAALASTREAAPTAAREAALASTREAALASTREAAPTAAREAVAVESVAEPDEGDGGRHLVPDELVRAATYRLAADRVARAKVPGAESAEDEKGAAPGGDGQETTRLRSVPRPRSS
ncbi:hypothetical protein AB0M36_02105 [Actinoplanes sp. NPDC051346]|uniref:hypothetical protein n=1 Tax=Actinoplanes sp. NPDC051346 TaxID=3155048 RepID=UPI003412AD74